MKKQAPKPKNWIRYYDDRDILDAGLDRYLTKPLRKKAIISEIVAYCPNDAVAPCPDELDQAG